MTINAAFISLNITVLIILFEEQEYLSIYLFLCSGEMRRDYRIVFMLPGDSTTVTTNVMLQSHAVSQPPIRVSSFSRLKKDLVCFGYTSNELLDQLFLVELVITTSLKNASA